MNTLYVKYVCNGSPNSVHKTYEPGILLVQFAFGSAILTMKNGKTGKMKMLTFSPPDIQDSKTVFKYEIRTEF